MSSISSSASSRSIIFMATGFFCFLCILKKFVWLSERIEEESTSTPYRLPQTNPCRYVQVFGISLLDHPFGSMLAVTLCYHHKPKGQPTIFYNHTSYLSVECLRLFRLCSRPSASFFPFQNYNTRNLQTKTPNQRPPACWLADLAKNSKLITASYFSLVVFYALLDIRSSIRRRSNEAFMMSQHTRALARAHCAFCGPPPKSLNPWLTRSWKLHLPRSCVAFTLPK